MTSEKLGILGGGFGVYGYLAASPWEVVTLKKYSSEIQSRGLNSERLTFVEDLDQLVAQSTYMALAIPPTSQEKVIHAVAGRVKHCFLEKPFASSVPGWHASLLALSEKNQSFSVNYSLTQTAWWSRVFAFDQVAQHEIIWRQKSPSQNWKLDRREGGGMARFYGIHFAPALGLAYKLVFARESDQEFQLGLRLGKHDVNVSISLSPLNSFEILRHDKDSFCSTKSIYATPFGTSSPDKWFEDDPRVPLLREYLKSFGRSQLTVTSQLQEELSANMISNIRLL